MEAARKATKEEGVENVDYVCCTAESADWHDRYAYMCTNQLMALVRRLTTCGATQSRGSASAVFFFDCFHDMVDPLGAAKQAFAALKSEGGYVVLIEPLAADEAGIENALKVSVRRALSFPPFPPPQKKIAILLFDFSFSGSSRFCANVHVLLYPLWPGPRWKGCCTRYYNQPFSRPIHRSIMYALW